MRRVALATTAVALAALLTPAATLAKGPLEAALEGPGLDEPVRFIWTYSDAGDDARRAPIEHLALATGYFTAIFADASQETFDAASNALRARRPRGDLGPRYTLTYRLEGPGLDHGIVQDVYPYAKPRPVTYVPPSQYPNILGSWFVADESLTTALVRAGLPRHAPASDGSVHVRWAVIGSLAAFAAMLILTAGLRPRIRGQADARPTAR